MFLLELSWETLIQEELYLEVMCCLVRSFSNDWDDVYDFVDNWNFPLMILIRHSFSNQYENLRKQEYF